jgi:AcrR family transcriptional regulator
MPRNSAADAARTRHAIVERAVGIASVDGLEGVTIGRLAADLEMSKAGVVGQFGNKTGLQLAALESASRQFVDGVVTPVLEMEPGLDRLLALCDNWIDHVASRAFPGGCFMTAVSAEFDGRPGEVHDAVEERLRQWRKFLRREVKAAVEEGGSAPDADPDQIVFELQAMAMGLNQAIQLYGDRGASARARRFVRRSLELAPAAA